MSAKRIVLIALVAALALGGGYFARQSLNRGAPDAGAREALFAARFPDLGGTPQPLSQWQGKLLIVNFWATWCAPCREEIPMFVRLQENLRERSVLFVGIAIDQHSKVQAFSREVGMNYPVLLGELEAMELARKLGNHAGGLPFSVVVDRQGRIVKTETGILSESKLTSLIQSLL